MRLAELFDEILQHLPLAKTALQGARTNRLKDPDRVAFICFKGKLEFVVHKVDGRTGNNFQ